MLRACQTLDDLDKWLDFSVVLVAAYRSCKFGLKVIVVVLPGSVLVNVKSASRATVDLYQVNFLQAAGDPGMTLRCQFPLLN